MVGMRTILATGGGCDGSAPQGLQLPGEVLHIDAPWDATFRRYNFTQRISVFNGFQYNFGRGDFMLSATVTPQVDGQVELQGQRLSLGDRATLISRVGTLGRRQFRGYALQISDSLVELAVADGGSDARVRALIPDGWHANVPRVVKGGRIGRLLFVSVDGVVLDTTNVTGDIQDVDSNVSDPLIIGSLGFNSGFFPSILLGYLSDISVSSFAQLH